MNIVGKTCVITGAASGIGRALAIELSKHDCDLALVDRDETGLKETVAQLKKGSKVTIHIIDLSDREQTKTLYGKVIAEHAKVDILINNAGVALGGEFDDVSEKDFDWLMAINFQAPVDLTRAFLPHLKQNNTTAKIVNVSSLYGIIAPPGQTAYSASKFALRGFSHALRHELKHTMVDVMVVHPGGIATSIAKSAKVPEDADPDEVKKQKKAMERLLKMPPTEAALVIINGIKKDKTKVLVGSDAKLASFLEWLFPVRYWDIIGWIIKRSI